MDVGNFAADFDDWRNTPVNIYPFVKYDKFGTPSYGTAVQTMVYIEMHPKMIQNSTGQEVVSQARLYVIGNLTYDVRDKLVLPDNKAPPVLRLDHYWNEVGVLELSVFSI